MKKQLDRIKKIIYIPIVFFIIGVLFENYQLFFFTPSSFYKNYQKRICAASVSNNSPLLSKKNELNQFETISRIKLDAHLEKDCFYIGEEIKVKYNITNNSLKTFLLECNSSDLLFIENDEGYVKNIRSINYPDYWNYMDKNILGAHYEINPNSVISGSTIANNSYDLSKPGLYKLAVKMLITSSSGEKLSLTSDKIELQIIPDTYLFKPMKVIYKSNQIALLGKNKDNFKNKNFISALQLNINSKKNKYYYFEDIYIDILFKNPSNDFIYLSYFGDILANNLTFDIYQYDNSKISPLLVYKKEIDFYSKNSHSISEKLKIHESIENNMILSPQQVVFIPICINKLFDMNEPGKYIIFVKIKYFDEEAISNPLCINIL